MKAKNIVLYILVIAAIMIGIMNTLLIFKLIQNKNDSNDSGNTEQIDSLVGTWKYNQSDYYVIYSDGTIYNIELYYLNNEAKYYSNVTKGYIDNNTAIFTNYSSGFYYDATTDSNIYYNSIDEMKFDTYAYTREFSIINDTTIEIGNTYIKVSNNCITDSIELSNL